MVFNRYLRLWITPILGLSVLLGLSRSSLPLAAQTTAPTYYVALNGSDSNGNGSSSNPFRTIQKAANVATPGATVIVRPGVYYERRIRINRTDSSDLPITFKAEPGAIVDHSLRVSSWASDGGSVYKAVPDFSDPADQPYPNVKQWTNMVVVADRPLTRVYSRSEVKEGTFYVDTSNGMVYVWTFGGTNPANETTLVMNAKDEPVYYYPGIQLSRTTKHVVFDGFVHRGAGSAIAAGEWASPVSGSDLTIKNCRIEHNWQYAVQFNSWNGATIDNCEIKNAGLFNWPRGRYERDEAGNIIYTNGQPQEAGWPHAIIGWNGDNITVQNSRIHDNHGEGVGPFEDCSGWKILNNTVYDNFSVNIYVDTSESNVLVDSNLVYNDPSNYQADKNNPKLAQRSNPDGIRVANEKADLSKNDATPAVNNITLTNNIVLGTGGGIMSFPYSNGSYYLKDSLIANNTVVTSINGSLGDAALAVTSGDNVRVTNNIVYSNTLYLDDAQGAGIQAQNNLVQNSSKLVVQGGAIASGTVFGEPNFTVGTGLSASNYTLQASSPARNAGLTLSEVTRDYAGVQRPQESTYEIGAYEFTGTANALLRAGTYTIAALHSNKLLDVYQVKPDQGTPIIQWSANGGANQKWGLEPLSDGTYKLTAQHSGLVMDAKYAGTTAGTPIWQWPWNETCAQRWDIQSAGNGTYKLRSTCGNNVLEVADSNTSNGATVQLGVANNGNNQRFSFTQLLP
jgi:hypothetical protein